MFEKENIGELFIVANYKGFQVKNTAYRESGAIPIVDQSKEYISAYTNENQNIYPGVLPVIIFGDHTRVVKFITFPFACGADGTQVLKARNTDPHYLYYLISRTAQWLGNYGYDRHFKHLKKENVLFQKSLPHQRKIARILSTLDSLIEKTEVAIDKQKKIRDGMMQDLFTRGVDEKGRLRPTREEATELYKETEIGWIPKEWDVVRLGDVVESAIDGPFGSNLKTEHYINQPGVRVIRLQNVTGEGFSGIDKAWISREHADRLSRHSAIEGDLLVASLGDDNNLLGRACLLPGLVGYAIVKADVFRLRADPKIVSNVFLLGLLNHPKWHVLLHKYAQGVTRDRINLGNLLQVHIPIAKIEEQLLMDEYLCKENMIHNLEQELAKLQNLKSGLMEDLLSGKVEVTPDPEDYEGE